MSRNEIIEFISATKENDFTKDTLIPLLERRGFTSVEFHGGVCEEGKDVIARSENRLGREEIWVFQVKRLDDSSVTKAKPEWMKLVSQLRQAKKKAIATKEIVERKPDVVVAVISNRITTRLMTDQLENIEDIHGVEVIDAENITDWIIASWPNYLGEVAGITEVLSGSQLDELQNIELSSALKYNETEINCKKSFSHLNFNFGNVSSSLILKLHCSAENFSVKLKSSSWKQYCKSIATFEQLMTDIFSSDIESCKKEYDFQLEKFESDENKEFEEQLKIECSNLGNLQRQKSKMLDAALSEVEEYSKHQSNDELARDFVKYIHSFKNSGSEKKDFDISIFEELPSNLRSTVTSLPEVNKKITITTGAIEHITKMVVREPLYEHPIYAKKLADRFNELVSIIRADIISVNSKKFRSEALGNILSNFELLQQLRKYIQFLDLESEELNFRLTKENVDFSRIEISPYDVFDIGRNIAVFGMAGAGKTTTLHMYGKYLLDFQNENKLLLFSPLNRMMHAVMLSKFSLSITKNMTDDEYIKLFFKCFLIQKGRAYDDESVDVLIKYIVKSDKKPVLMLDGLDEVASEHRWIIKVINILPKRMPKIQVIVSSRDAVNYLNKINYIGITLLPFTQDQLINFISSWQWPSHKSPEKLISKIESKDLFNVIKNPLLATLVCNLHAKGQNIPNSERDIYSKYLKLLCGVYDDHKYVSRNEIDSDGLEVFASRVALLCQNKRIRDFNFDELLKVILREFSHKYSHKFIKLAFKELLDPSNVLVNDSNSRLKFFHLRIQEYLSSKALLNDHSLEVAISHLGDDWWRGTLYLYASSCDMDSLITQAYDYYGRQFEKAEPTIKAMISAMEPRLRSGLREILEMYIEQSKQEDSFVYFEDFYYPEGDYI